MDRKAKEISMKQAQERAAQQEAKTAHLRVVKAEMAKAREVSCRGRSDQVPDHHQSQKPLTRSMSANHQHLFVATACAEVLGF
jgi:hypothetical protein